METENLIVEETQTEELNPTEKLIKRMSDAAGICKMVMIVQGLSALGCTIFALQAGNAIAFIPVLEIGFSLFIIYAIYLMLSGISLMVSNSLNLQHEEEKTEPETEEEQEESAN